MKLVESGKVRVGEYLLDLAVGKDARLPTTRTRCRPSLENATGLITGRVPELEAAAVEAETHYGNYKL
jgi:hypothetical protein